VREFVPSYGTWFRFVELTSDLRPAGQPRGEGASAAEAGFWGATRWHDWKSCPSRSCAVSEGRDSAREIPIRLFLDALGVAQGRLSPRSLREPPAEAGGLPENAGLRDDAFLFGFGGMAEGGCHRMNAKSKSPP
jgi:hypothetical protein